MTAATTLRNSSISRLCVSCAQLMTTVAVKLQRTGQCLLLWPQMWLHGCLTCLVVWPCCATSLQPSSCSWPAGKPSAQREHACLPSAMLTCRLVSGARAHRRSQLGQVPRRGQLGRVFKWASQQAPAGFEPASLRDSCTQLAKKSCWKLRLDWCVPAAASPPCLSR